MDHAYDVVVIGCGVAGAAAALAAADAGARCAIISAAPGATGISAGGWRGEPPAALVQRLAHAGLPLLPCTAPLPHPGGELRSYAAAAATHAAAAPTAGTLVLGIAGLPGFRAGALARLWGDAAGVELKAATVTLPRTPAAGWAPASLAQVLEREPALLADAAATAGHRAAAERVIVPAVLGLDRWSHVHAEVQRAVAVPVGEALGVPPSLPGLRLQRALDGAVQRAGIVVVRGRFGDAALEHGAVTSGRVSGRGGDVVVSARVWVLATGRFAGGGISADPVWREPALGTPLHVLHLGRRFDVMEPLALSDVDRAGRQPWSEVGVATDDAARPVGPGGEPSYANVLAAGAVVAGCAPGLGDAARHGWIAGARAAAMAGADATAGKAAHA